MRNAITFVCVAAAALFAGCTVGPDYRCPPAALPAQWASPASDAQQTVASHPVAEPVDTRWWQQFGDPELTSLIERVAAANLDVEEAGTRVAGARAARRMTGADAAPSVSARASYEHARSSQNGLVDISGLGGKSDYNV